MKIPYETGMNPYSGLVELFEKKNLLVKQGNRLRYTNLAGEEQIEYRKQWLGPKLDLIMSEYDEKMKPVVNTAEVDLEEEATADQIEEIAIND